MRFVIALLITIVMALPVASRPLTMTEQANLNSTLASYIHALQTKRMRQVVDVISPKLIAAIAKSMNTTPQKMRRKMRAELKGVRYSDIQVITTGLDARDAKASDGAPIVYTFVPMNFKIHYQGRHFAITSSNLALLENGTWYFMRIQNGGQKAIIADVYPFLKSIRFPIDKMVQQ